VDSVTDPGASDRTKGGPLDFDEVFKLHLGYVMHSLRRLGVRESDLEDLAHDVFVIVHRKASDFDPARPIKPWLFGIAVRTASEHRRKASVRREMIGHTDEPVEPSPDAERIVEEKQKRELVVRALESVDESRLPVLVMHDIDGFGMPEVVEALGIPLNTGYSRLRLARAEFALAVSRLRKRGGTP
jgi:RNA polymerase sigma-70 factor (ECF subfamily)